MLRSSYPHDGMTARFPQRAPFLFGMRREHVLERRCAPMLRGPLFTMICQAHTFSTKRDSGLSWARRTAHESFLGYVASHTLLIGGRCVIAIRT
jgi:hypothetical protein